MFETSKVTATTLVVAFSLAGTTTQLRAEASCAWTLQETLRIGSIAAEDALSAVLDLEVGPEGDIYIAQQFLPHVTVFTPDGCPSRTIGRAGSGPGEFDGQPIYLGWMRDTLWATDLAATHFFARDGRPGRQVEFRVHVPEESSVFMPRRPLADGTFLARRNATTAGGGNMADFFEAERERDRRAAREAITFPDHHPPVRRIVAGDDGSIWLLRELDLPDRVDRWDVYDEEGAFEGTVLVEERRGDSHPWAPRLRVLRATREEVWGTTLGELDEPYVHRYAVDTTYR